MLRGLIRFAALTALILAGLLAYGYVSTIQPSLARERCDTAPVEPGRLEAHVKMLAKTFAPRDYTHPEHLKQTADYVKAQLSAAGGSVSEQHFTVEGRDYWNVLAAFGPESAERIVIGAHYDVCEPKPGADDNASGVAALLELAQRLGKNPPPMRVELVGYTLEEPPFFRTRNMGSAVHADALAQANVKVRAMMSLEMLGYFTDQPDTQKFPMAPLSWLFPSTGNYLIVVGERGKGDIVPTIKRAMRGASALPVESINAPSFVPGVDFSDQLYYWKHGFPAVMITDTAFLRNANYHQTTDLPETLDYPRLGMAVQGVECAVRTLAKQ